MSNRHNLFAYWTKPPRPPLSAPVRALIARLTGRPAQAVFWEAVEHNRRRLHDTEPPDLTPLLRLPELEELEEEYDVLFVSNAMLPVRGGGTRSFLHLARNLAALGLKVGVVCGGPAVRTFRFESIDFIWIVDEGDMREAIGRFRYRTMFCQQSWAPAAAKIAEDQGNECWYFLRSIEDVVPDSEGVYEASALAALARQSDRSALILRADRVVANSRFVQAIVREAFDRECDVIYPGIEPPAPWELRRTNLACSILAMGGTQKKGIDIVIELASAFPDERFLVCGVKSMPAKYNQKNLPKNLRWLGQVDTSAAYTMGKLVLMPSLWPEPLGRVCPEALMRGIPVLASRVGGIPEVVMEPQFLVDDFTNARAWKDALGALLPKTGRSSIRQKALARGAAYQSMQALDPALSARLRIAEPARQMDQQE